MNDKPAGDNSWKMLKGYTWIQSFARLFITVVHLLCKEKIFIMVPMFFITSLLHSISFCFLICPWNTPHSSVYQHFKGLNFLFHKSPINPRDRTTYVAYKCNYIAWINNKITWLNDASLVCLFSIQAYKWCIIKSSYFIIDSSITNCIVNALYHHSICFTLEHVEYQNQCHTKAMKKTANMFLPNYANCYNRLSEMPLFQQMELSTIIMLCPLSQKFGNNWFQLL